MTVFEKIKIIARDVLNLDPDCITLESRIREDLNVSDRSAYDLYTKAQEIFPGFQASLDEARRLKTIGDIVDMVKNKVGGQ